MRNRMAVTRALLIASDRVAPPSVTTSRTAATGPSADDVDRMVDRGHRHDYLFHAEQPGVAAPGGPAPVECPVRKLGGEIATPAQTSVLILREKEVLRAVDRAGTRQQIRMRSDHEPSGLRPRVALRRAV